MRSLLWILTMIPLLTTAGCTSQNKPIVIGHRGASGYLPEHTLEAYALAIEQGADFIEPDLVSTRDGVLVARHENEISGTTDVARRFPNRKSTKTIDGERVEGWFTEDFTLAELKTIRARQRLAFRDQSKNGQFEIPTFEEILAFVREESKKRGRTIGIYPETKHPSYFQSIGLSLEEPLVEQLGAYGYTSERDAVFVQSFEISNLKKLNSLTRVSLVQLIGELDTMPFDQVLLKREGGSGLTYAQMLTPRGLRDIAAYAQGIGPSKRALIPEDKDGKLLSPTDLVARAHRAGLRVHPYTFRSDPSYLAVEYAGRPAAEYVQFFELGVDGVFSDFPDTALEARGKWIR